MIGGVDLIQAGIVKAIDIRVRPRELTEVSVQFLDAECFGEPGGIRIDPVALVSIAESQGFKIEPPAECQ